MSRNFYRQRFNGGFWKVGSRLLVHRESGSWRGQVALSCSWEAGFYISAEVSRNHAIGSTIGEYFRHALGIS